MSERLDSGIIGAPVPEPFHRLALGLADPLRQFDHPANPIGGYSHHAFVVACGTRLVLSRRAVPSPGSSAP